MKTVVEAVKTGWEEHECGSDRSAETTKRRTTV